MRLKDHITILKTDGLVKGTEELNKKVKAEISKPDPKNAEEVVLRNTKATLDIKEENGKKEKEQAKAAPTNRSKDVPNNKQDSQGTLKKE